MHMKQYSLAAAFAAVAFAQDNQQSLQDVIAGNKDLTLLGTFLKQDQQLSDQLGGSQNITLLAPSNTAIQALLKTLGGKQPDPNDVTALLTYHVLAGTYMSDDITEDAMFVPTLLEDQDYTMVTGGQVVEVMKDGNDVMITSGLLSQSTVSQADIQFAGGVVHIIDTVLTIPMSVSETATDAGLSATVGALMTAGLVNDVDTASDLTIFAPSNDAFEAIGSILKGTSKKDLSDILMYHAVSGNIGYSTDLKDGMMLETLGGGKVTITMNDDGDIFVNAAKVITPDVLVGNGVVHVIDAVLNPDDTDEAEDDATEGVVAYSKASSATLAITSNVPKASTTIGSAATPTKGGKMSTSSSTEGAPMMTGAVGAAALFGAGVAVFNL